MNPSKDPGGADHFLDITELVCPMTFVRTKLLLERMAPGETCEVRLRGAEPLENVPRSARELGHTIVSLEAEPADEAPAAAAAEPIHRLVIRKGAA